MRPLYIFVKIGIFLSSRIFFRKIRKINSPKKIHEPVILVSNHPSALMDPILVGANQKLAIHFMVRSDIFRKGIMWFFNGCQMIPIYRTKEDGRESHRKNQESFAKVRRLLQNGKAILWFAEGYTDNQFIRSLKPIKKGPARVGFEAMEECEWAKPLKFMALGMNYSHPQHMRSNLLMCYSDQIDIHDYRKEYEENSAAAISWLTKDLRHLMREQLTYAENAVIGEFTENIMRLNRKGMNNENYDFSIPLGERFNYSRSLASTLNEKYDSDTNSFDEQLNKLNDNLKKYFDDQESSAVEENWVFRSVHPVGSVVIDILYLITFLPFFILGAMQSIVPYLIIKIWAERSLKRKVFWSSFKMVAGWFTIGVFNIPVIFLFYNFVFPYIWLSLAYYFIAIPISLTLAYVYKKRFLDFVMRMRASKLKIKEYAKRRAELVEQMEKVDFI